MNAKNNRPNHPNRNRNQTQGQQRVSKTTTAEQQNLGTPDETRRERKQPPEKNDYRENLIAWGAVVAAIGGVLAAVFTGWQANVAVDTEHRQLRAYVGPDNFTIGLAPQAGTGITQEPYVFLTMKNGGMTPANDVSVTPNYWPLMNWQFPSNFDCKDTETLKASGQKVFCFRNKKEQLLGQPFRSAKCSPTCLLFVRCISDISTTETFLVSVIEQIFV